MEDTIAMVTIITYILGLYALNLLITKKHLPWLPFWKMKTVSLQGIYVCVRGVHGKKKKRNVTPTFVFAVSGSCPFLPRWDSRTMPTGQPQPELSFLHPFNQLQEPFCIFPARLLPV